MTLDDILRLFSGSSSPIADGDGWLLHCPLHISAMPELRFAQKGKKVSVLCLANCRTIDVLKVHNLTIADLNGKGSVNGHRPQSPPPNPPPGVQAQSSPQQPPQKRTIDISIDDLPRMNAESWEAITEQNEPPILFTHGDGVVRTRYDYHDDKLILDTASVDVLRHELSQMADWIVTRTNKKTNVTKTTVTKPPVFLVKDVLASRVIPLPRLNRVVTVPVFAPDGTLITAPGYNPSSGVIYAPPRGYTSLPVPDTIASTHLDEAKKLIEELICDFPFTCDDAGDSPDHDNAIALMLLPFVRDMIDGPTPLHLIEASMPGSGKGLLAISSLYPAIGEISGAPFPGRDDELRKAITASLVSCKPVIWFDNVNRPITSGEFAGALTMNVWDDRILGASTLVNARVHAVWLVTGNNVTLSGDIARRSIRIRLTPQTDKPEERTAFTHPNQIEWIKTHRAELIWSAHVICKYAIQQKLPSAKSRVIGSYEQWSRLLGSILECAGYSQFLGNYRSLLDSSNTKSQALSFFTLQWFKDKGEDIVTAHDLLAIADDIEGIPLKGDTDKAKNISLGNWLKAQHQIVTECVDPITNEIYHLQITSLGVDTTGKHKKGSRLFKLERLIDDTLF